MAAAASNSRNRSWCFTVNNYEPSDEVNLRTLSSSANYLIFGRETGASGTRHLQGYIYFDSARTFTSVKRSLGDRAHIEASRGTPEDNKRYCSKDGDFEEFGTLPKQGKRNDLDATRELLKRGATMADIVDQATNCTQIKYAEMFMKYRNPVYRQKPEVVWIYGGSGLGKSTLARNMIGRRHVYYKPAGKWWDGYTNERKVLWDDFRESDYPANELYSLLDDAPFRVEIKGTSTYMSAETFYFTSIKAPWMVYGSEPPTQLLRRLSMIVCVSDDANDLQVMRIAVMANCGHLPNVKIECCHLFPAV